MSPAGRVTVAERRESIVGRIADSGRVEVAELADALAVTEETIRRDLRSLEAQGMVRRAHGGAVRPDIARPASAGPDPVLATAALVAAGLVGTADTVFVDAGSAGAAVAAALPAGVRVVTASAPVALAAARAEAPKDVLLLGGRTDPRGTGSGPWTREGLRSLRLTAAFLEADAIADDGRLFTAGPEAASVKSEAIAAAQRRVLLPLPAESTRAGSAVFASVGELTDAVVAPADAMMRELLAAEGVAVHGMTEEDG